MSRDLTLETGVPRPYNPLDLPCGFDRADGLGGRHGTPSGETQIQVESYLGSGIDNLPIEEDDDSPVIELGEQITVTHRYRMGWLNAATRAATLGRGIIRQDSAGNLMKMVSCTVQRQAAGKATVTTVEEWMNGDTPPDLFECVPVDLGLDILKHPRYLGAFIGEQGIDSTYGFGSAIEVKNQAVIRMLQQYFDEPNYAMKNAIQKLIEDSIGQENPGGTQPPNPPSLDPDTNAYEWGTGVYVQGTNRAKRAALEIIGKYWRGLEKPPISGFAISWTEFFWYPFPLNPGGFIENPITEGGLPEFLWDTQFPPNPAHVGTDLFWALAGICPQSYSSNGQKTGSVNISWRRLADQEVRERTFFGIRHRWEGSPVGFWDPQIYTRYRRPYNPDGTDYLPSQSGQTYTPITTS